MSCGGYVMGDCICTDKARKNGGQRPRLLEMVKPARRISPQMPVVTILPVYTYLPEYTKLHPVIYDARPDM